MSRFPARMTKTARRLIRKYGQIENVIWRQLTDGAVVDPNKPWSGAALTHIDHVDIEIVFVNAERLGQENQHPMNSLMIPQSQRLNVNSYNDQGFSEQSVGNLIGYMAGDVPFKPSFKDIVIRDGVEHRIKTVNNYDPSGPVIVYQILFEK